MSQERFIKAFEEWGPANIGFTANVIQGSEPDLLDFEGKDNNNGCHYRMNYVIENKKKYFGQFLPVGRKKPEFRAYLKFILGPYSPYRSLLDHVGDRFQPVYHGKDMFAWTMTDVVKDTNFLMIHNFFKSIRMFSQYEGFNGAFWKEWAYEKKKNPALAMVLSSYIRAGQKGRDGKFTYPTWRNGECYITPGGVPIIDMRILMSNTHGLHDPADHKWKTITGEEKYMWGVKDDNHGFSPFKDIISVRKNIENTRFVQIYEKKAKDVYEEDVLTNFFDRHPYMNKKGITCAD